MTITTATGTCVAVSATLPATHDEQGFAALVYTTVGELESLGELVVEHSLGAITNLCTGKTTQVKGDERYTPVEIVIGLDRDDAGQNLLTDARASRVARVAVQITEPLGGITFFQAQVLAEQITGGDGPNDVQRGAYTLGVWMPPAADPVVQTSASLLPPDLDSIAAYQDESNPLSYTSIPYSTPGLAPQDWVEEINSGTEQQSQAFDLALPSGTAPVGGWPVVLYLHPRGATKYIEPGSAQDTQLKQKALTTGKAFASGWHRNPSVNFNWDGQNSIPLTDPGLIIQHLRALAPALNLNPNAILVVGVSKGNDYLACTYSGDLANPASPTYAGRQSSIPNAGYSVNAQMYYDSAKWADEFVPPANRAAFLAVNPSNPAFPNSAELIATAPVDCLIPLAMVHEAAYVAFPHISAVDDVHFSGNGVKARLAYEARGYGHRITAWAGEPTSADRLGLAVPWWDNLRAGMTVREAAAAARARVRNAGFYYARSDLSGMAQNSDGTGAIAVDGVIGGLVDGSYGLSNRAAVAASLGYPIGQPGGTNLKPTLRAKGNGQLCIRFDALNDKLFVNYPNDGTPNVRGWADVVLTNYLGATNATTVQVGVSSGELTWASKDVSLIVIQNEVMTAADERLYANFAQELSGVQYPNQAL